MSHRQPARSIHPDYENRWTYEARATLNESRQLSARSTSPNHCSRLRATRATFPLALLRVPFLSPSLTSASLSRFSACATHDDRYTPTPLATPISEKHVLYRRLPLSPPGLCRGSERGASPFVNWGRSALRGF